MLCKMPPNRLKLTATLLEIMRPPQLSLIAIPQETRTETEKDKILIVE